MVKSLGDDMKSLFSPRSRYSTWRQLWLWLAEAQKRKVFLLGLYVLH